MCDHTWCSDPAQPSFWLNWPPNEEQIENFQIISYCLKIVGVSIQKIALSSNHYTNEKLTH